ncbi:hypothetical protein [Aureimonas frigidaquae]|uniref:hypothetical protein n=1 Tax=Aureimonas frigidaquae TaxID=424757 RepID=UPI0007842FCE|nr:hypothetical protein [Aureimonas frigidaquae]
MPIVLRPASLLILTAVLSGCVTSGASRQAPAVPDGSLGSELSALGLTGDAQGEAARAEYQALQFGAVGQPIEWRSGGYAGQVVPTQLYRVGSQDCRGFTHTVTRSGRTTQQVGSACRTGDVWTPVA